MQTAVGRADAGLAWPSLAQRPYYGTMAEPGTGTDYAETERHIREIVETAIARYEPTR